MKIIKLIKKNKGNILIIVGVFLILYSILSIYKWKFVQSNIINQDKVSSDGKLFAEEDLELPIVEKNKENEKKLEDDKKDVNNEIERQNYKRGEMIIEIPSIDVKAAIMEGTTIELLKQGPGLYEISPLPSKDANNVCIAGHRTTYGAWFRNVDKLKEGDHIILSFNEKKYVYKVEKVFVVEKNDWSVTNLTGYSSITLTSCHPVGSSKQRIIVRGKLDKIIGN